MALLLRERINAASTNGSAAADRRHRIAVVLVAVSAVSLAIIGPAATLMPRVPIAGPMLTASFIAFVAALVYAATAIESSRPWRLRVLVPVIVALGTTVPLVAVNPIGPRNMYLPYIMFMVSVVALVTRLQPRSLGTRFHATVAFVAVIAFGVQFGTYALIHARWTERIETVKAAVERGDKSVTITQMPFADALHDAELENTFWLNRFKVYYGIPQDLIVRTRPCDGWVVTDDC